MPIYRYKCPGCDNFEEQLFLNYKSSVDANIICGVCGLEELPRTFEGNSISLTKGFRKSKGFVQGELKRAQDMKKELSRDYLVEEMTGLQGQGFNELYDNIKANGNQVREDMQRRMEKTSKEADVRQKEWKKGAVKRHGKRVEEIKERKAKEAQVKGRIILPDSKPAKKKKK